MPNVLLDSSEQVQVFILNLDVPGEERLREVICNRLSLFCTPIGVIRRGYDKVLAIIEDQL